MTFFWTGIPPTHGLRVLVEAPSLHERRDGRFVPSLQQAKRERSL